jgi:hypothetical protein
LSCASFLLQSVVGTIRRFLQRPRQGRVLYQPGAFDVPDSEWTDSAPNGVLPREILLKDEGEEIPAGAGSQEDPLIVSDESMGDVQSMLSEDKEMELDESFTEHTEVLAGRCNWGFTTCNCVGEEDEKFARRLHKLPTVLNDWERRRKSQENIIFFNHMRQELEGAVVENEGFWIRNCRGRAIKPNDACITQLLTIITESLLSQSETILSDLLVEKEDIQVEKEGVTEEDKAAIPEYFGAILRREEEGKKQSRDEFVEVAAMLNMASMYLVKMAASEEDDEFEEHFDGGFVWLMKRWEVNTCLTCGNKRT